MITAWVLYFDHSQGRYALKELNGSAYTNTDPTSWGLHEDDVVILCLQQGSFMQAWVEGKETRKAW